MTATPLRPGYDGSLTVIAYRNASGTGVAGATGAASGAPDVYLPGIPTASWVFAVGNDWDRAVARTPVAGQAAPGPVDRHRLGRHLLGAVDGGARAPRRGS